MSFRRSQFITSTQNTSEITEAAHTLPYFKTVLKEAGVHFTEDESPDIITQEQSLVIRDIEKILKNHEAYPNNVQEFIKDLKGFCESEDNFRKSLMNMYLKKSSGSGGTSEIKIQQESLIRILLNIGALQPDIIDLILEQVTTHASEEESDTGCLRLLLNALRYLSHIQDSKTLTTKLLDILEIAAYPSQLEILNSIPEIFPDSQYDEAATQLSRLLSSNNNLTAAILDCLNSFSLSNEIRGEIQTYILDNLLTCSSGKIFPILFEFLVTDCKSENLLNILLKCRNSLDAILSSESSEKDVESNKVLALNKLYFCGAIPKQLYEGWINVISSLRVHTEHKPVDVIILIILHTTGIARKKVVESLLKKRIRACLFKTSLIENMFKKYIVTQFLNDYTTSLIELSVSLLRHPNDNHMIEFASMLLKLLFCHNLTNRVQRQDILHNLILLTGSCDQKTIRCVLNIFTELSKDNKMKQHAVQLMGLLEKLDTYELPAVKQIFELLCSLTCGPEADESMSGLKDEIHMLVRKQLSSSKKSIKHRGIISAVVMTKYVAIVTEDQSDISIADESMIIISDLPRGPAQEAASLLELTNTCSSSSAEFKGLYYDQLASMIITSENLDKYFMAWMFETITNDFQDIFVTENAPDALNDIQISAQYSLNSVEEVNAPINVNIAELTIRSGENNNILILAPLFRLLRLLHYQHQNGDLSSIDALLGCGVLMPTVDDINIFDIDQVHQIADCLFYCINWFREIISAFVTQKNRKLRQRVIQRLGQLVKLEELLQECMEIVPNHKLPASYFHVASSTAKRPPNSPSKSPRPKKKTKSRATVVDQDVTVASTAAPTQTTRIAPLKKYVSRDFNFREVDIDLILILKYPLRLGDTGVPLHNLTQSTPSSTQSSTFIDIKQFIFLMKDFVTKLNCLTKNGDLGLSYLNVVCPGDLIADSAKLLPCINQHFKVIQDGLKKLIEENGGYDSQDLHTSEAVSLKIGFNLTLECFSLIFGWSGFQNSKNLNLLRDCLRSLRSDTQTQLNSANRLIVEFAENINSYVDQCLYLPTAVNLIYILQALYNINANPEIQKCIVSTSGKLLTKKWYNLNGEPDSGKNYINNIDVLAKSYLNGASVKTICGLVATLQNQITELSNKQDCLQILPSFNKGTFHILYRWLCTALLERVKTEIASLTNSQHLVLWKTTALTMQGLMMIAKVHETRVNLVCFLKKSLGILKIFLSQGIPILEIVMRTKTDQVIEIFKTIQTSTRFLHHLCCYSKITKDASLTAFVPQFRLTLETLVYRVKAALVVNNCSAAFWMGNLRNKNLHGEDIMSQSTNMSGETTEQNSEEELPEDDSADEVEAELMSEDETASEVFD